MKFFTKLSWIPFLMAVIGLLAIASCGDDKKPEPEPPKAGIQFETTTLDVNESDGVIEITISVDEPLASRVVLAYSLSGTAIEGPFTDNDSDYEMKPKGGFISIEEGETEAQIEIELFEDYDLEFEFDDLEEEISSTVETAIITLTEVVSGPGILGEQNIFTLNVYEDDLWIFTTWDTGEGNPEDVDMDMFVWIDNPEDEPDAGFLVMDPEDVGGGIRISPESESVIILGGFPEASYGLSFVYYEGTSDELEFTVTYVNFGGAINGGSSITQRTGNYTLANINKWDDEDLGTDFIKVQDFEKEAFNIVNLTEITTPDSGSRLGLISKQIDHSKFKRGPVSKNYKLQ